MPYVFWTQWPLNMPGRSDTDLPQVSENQPTPRAPIVHNSLTLDQYYYVSLKDTAKRDRDQVLWRFMEVEKQRLRLEEERKLSGYKREATSRVERHYNEAQAEAMELKIEKVVGSTQILIVNQLWLWILDEKTIITSTTKEPEGIESSFFQRVLTTLRAQERSSWLSVEYVTELILSTATGMFNKKEIKFLDLKKSPLDVYRESILNVSLKSANPSDSRSRSLSRADTTAAKTTSYAKWDSLGGRNGTLQAKIRRAQLTQDLEKEPRIMQTEDKTEEKPPKQELGGSIWEQLKNWWNRKDTDSQKDSNPYHDIAREAELLREVKDISDELNMLKNLAEDQEGVWKQFWVPGTTPRTTYTYDTPSEIKGEIEEMIKEAEFVQQAIDTLLDLKQKQANITEAQYSRKQSDDTATQSDTVMVFTVVTILFVSCSDDCAIT
ncbi:ankyrin [Penicillium chermesinum]|uniref:Ankyrin n=1 Tax=Penicillium chermesinum TaxID=63820 RepID=A0A9W9N7X3_9EURO|nr:ankyrin [Penicillium chermesinum]KAJ5214905.1 ankyrin [Penicillium chermesinum]